MTDNELAKGLLERAVHAENTAEDLRLSLATVTAALTASRQEVSDLRRDWEELEAALTSEVEFRVAAEDEVYRLRAGGAR